MSAGIKANTDGISGALQVNGTDVVYVATTGAQVFGTLTATNVVTPNNLTVGGLPTFECRAWGAFSGSTAAVRASGNVSSITRVSTGVYRVSLTTAMPDTNYAVTGSVQHITGQGGMSFETTATAYTTSQFELLASVYNAQVDPPSVQFAVIR